MEKGGASTRTPHAVLVSSPGTGHLNPLLALAKRLSCLHSFKVTILLVSSDGAPQTAGEQYSDHVSLVKIPAADISKKVDQGAHLVTKICAMMLETEPSVRASISGLTDPTPTVVILDLFATSYLPIARELALPCFVYVAGAWCLALLVYCPILDKEMEGEYADLTGPIDIPGFKPIRPEDVMQPMLQRSQPQYAEFMRMGAEIPLFDGVITRSWQDLEDSTLTALREGHLLQGVPVYDIGPVVVQEEEAAAAAACDDEEKGMLLMEWLDRQPAQSVIYISFGSGGTLSTAQMNEVALGLELSQQRFLWVVRPPTDGGDSSGNYLGVKGAGDVDFIHRYLPQGFQERTHQVGLLVPHWAPQSKVLSHPSVGGFLTHCGWNSMMESLTNGVPMMAWPMYAEQRMNATMLVEDLKVAVRASYLPGKMVGREEIGKTVRLLLEGEEGLRLRSRAMDLQRGAEVALTPNGSSYNRLSDFVQAVTMLKLDHRLG